MAISISNCTLWKSNVGNVWGLTCVGQELFCRIVDTQTVNVYNTETGELKRTITLNCGGDYGALGTDGVDLYAYGEYKLYKVNKLDGSTTLVLSLGTTGDRPKSCATFAIRNGKLFTGSYPFGYWIIDIATGAIVTQNSNYNYSICYLDDENWAYLDTRYAGAKFYSGTTDTPFITKGEIIGNASTTSQNVGIGIDVKNKKVFTTGYTDGVLNIYDIDGVSDTTDPTDPTDPSTEFVLLRITMNDSSEREYKVTQSVADDFVNWCDRSLNTGDSCYVFDKEIQNRKEYLFYEKIISFEVTPIVE